MSVQALVTTITDAGRAAAVDAAANGLTLRITHLAFGDGETAPTSASTTLGNEIERIGVFGGQSIEAAVLEITALLESAETYRLSEIGVILEDGTLLAVAWRAAGIIEVAPDIPYPVSFHLTLVDIPAETITVEATTSLDIAFIGPIAALTQTNARLAMKQIDQELRLREREHLYSGGLTAMPTA